MVLYRGVLKSCNYHCSYCPFSKRPISQRELEKDRTQWFHFIQWLTGKEVLPYVHGLMVVPYGEALVHPWYWEGLARLSAVSSVDAVGAQTNFSFDLAKAMDIFRTWGGQIRKLRLWATFHPEMVSVKDFAEKCRKAWETGILICAGAVGVPENIPLLKQLRDILPKEIYLWINKMDGLKRLYTEEEIQEFSAVDPFFYRELQIVPARLQSCQGRIFAEGSGKLRLCNIGAPMSGRWFEEREGREDVNYLFFNHLFCNGASTVKCHQKSCSCYLAYGGRKDWVNDVLFGPYPIFRIPRRPKAVFLDIDGTLIPNGEDKVPESVIQDLEELAKRGETKLFFATSLPYREAMERCKAIRHLFYGGIFAAGAHLYLDGLPSGRYPEEGKPAKVWEKVYCFDGNRILPLLTEKKEHYHYRILAYRMGSQIYKISLVRPAKNPWNGQEISELTDLVVKGFGTGQCLKKQYSGNLRQEKQTAGQELKVPGRIRECPAEGIRVFAEDHCMQIVSAHASKENGVRQICGLLGIALKDTAAAGDGAEDKAMIALCGSR